MVVAAVQIGIGAFGTTPLSPFHLPPPGSARNPARWGEVVWQQSAEDERPAEALGLRRVGGLVDESDELGVRDGMSVDQEGLHPHAANRPLAVVRVGEA